MTGVRNPPLVSRRNVLRTGFAGISAAAVGAYGLHAGRAQETGSTPAATPASSTFLTEDLVRAFVTDAEVAMATFRVPGAAVALVEGDRIVYAGGFGVCDLETGTPVTDRTRFRIASNTKSMTSLLVATFVDEGILAWDDLVIDHWPEFQAPTAELTGSLRVRDLLGMGSGIEESPTIEFFISGGGETALDVLRSIANLEVFAPPATAYAYNNTLVSAAGYLGPMVQGTPPDELERAYAALVAERIFAPIGMDDAAILDDPRPLGGDDAVGHSYDLFGHASAVPFVSIGGVAPAGSGLASAADMARYLLTQMSGGVTPDGTRIVSTANLAETHKPGIAVPPDALNALPSILLSDTTAMHYALGWFDQTFVDGRRLLWHAGGIDGFGSLMGFFPEDEIGFVFLTNLEPGAGGSLFNIAIQSSLMSRVFGLNQALPNLLAGFVPLLDDQKAQLAAQTRPVVPDEVAPWLGLYSDGFFLRLDDAGGLWLDHDIRSLPLLALADGGYVMVDGPGVISARTVTFAEDATGLPTMSIDGFDTVRWLTGG